MSELLRQSCALTLLPAATIVIASVTGSVVAQSASGEPAVAEAGQTSWGQSANYYTAPATAVANQPTVEIPQQAAQWQVPNTYSSPAPAVRAAGRKATGSGRKSEQSGLVARSESYSPNTYVASAATPAYSVDASAVHGTAGRTPRRSVGSFLKKVIPGHSRGEAQVQTVSNIQPSKHNGMSQAGVASWYGSDWHGKKTANGERYNMNSLTAAHRSLPFGTLVKVQNTSNGRECVVRINNRGPFLKGRVLDCSKAAAEKLGFVGNGIAKIKMQVIGKS